MAVVAVGIFSIGSQGIASPRSNNSGGQQSGSTPGSALSSAAVTLAIAGSPVANSTSISASGGNSATLPAFETVPLVVTTTSPQPVNLTVMSAPSGVWVHFASASVQAGPDGVVVQMTLAGAVVTNYKENTTIAVRAAHGASFTDLSLNVVATVDFSALQSPSSPIEFNSAVVTNPTNSIPEYAGVVYDPAGWSAVPPATLSVGFSVAGILVNGETIATPQGLELSPPPTSLLLSPDQPAYFYIGVVTKDMAAGAYNVVINEQIGGKQFSSIMHIVVVQSGNDR
jgi:hypothetical protein